MIKFSGVLDPPRVFFPFVSFAFSFELLRQPVYEAEGSLMVTLVPLLIADDSVIIPLWFLII